MAQKVKECHRRGKFQLGEPRLDRQIDAQQSVIGQTQGANRCQCFRDAVDRKSRVRAQIGRIVTELAVNANRDGHSHLSAIL